MNSLRRQMYKELCNYGKILKTEDIIINEYIITVKVIEYDGNTIMTTMCNDIVLNLTTLH